MKNRLSKRNEVIDRQKGFCRRCDRKLILADTHIDHIKSKEDEGLNDLGNLQALCGSCHNKKTHEDRIRKGDKFKEETKSNGLLGEVHIPSQKDFDEALGSF